MTNERPTYEVTVSIDSEGYWNAAVEIDAGVFTFGRTLRQALQRTREAVALHLDIDKQAFDVQPRFADDELTQVVRQAQEAKAGAEHASDEWARTSRQAATAFTDAGFPVRDAAALLGVSPARIQQLLQLRQS